jgi:hypothetical protein
MSELINGNGRAEGTGASAKAWEKTVETDKIETTETASSAAPASHDPKALDVHADAGHHLIPIDGKRPVENGWRRSAPMLLNQAKARLAMGKNVGVRLLPTDLVIDVDPRNFAENDDPLGRLKAAFALPEAPFIKTGGGGQHLYLRKPFDAKIVNSSPEYPGIEFKSYGRQVVAAGSIHPDTGLPYALDSDPLALLLREAPEAPTALLDAIGKHSASASADTFGEITPEQLERLLSKLDVTIYNHRHDEWLNIMMACHHGTAGHGIDEFVAWSISDPEYESHEADFRSRWGSLTIRPGGVTIKTLYKALSDAGHGAWIEEVLRSSARDDFPLVLDDDDFETSSSWDAWVFVADAMQFIRRSDGRKYRQDQWKALYSDRYTDGDILAAVWKSKIPVRKFEQLVYLPETGEFPDGIGGQRYNIWRKSGIAADFGDVKPFLDHMAFLFPNEDDRDLVLDYLALLTQHPAEKIHFALLIRGAQGTGKSWIGNLMERIIGKPNVVRPSNDEVISRWTSWLEGAQLAIVEELMTLGRLEVANRLKPVITDPMIRIEEKNCPLYSIPNHINFLCFTNHDDALKIEHEDRRWLVVFSPAAKKDAAYYDSLFGYLDSGGAAFVKYWLLQRHTVLNPHGVAPPTSGKETMRRMSLGDAEAYLLELYECDEEPFVFDLVRVDDLVNAVPSSLRGKANLRSRLSKFLKDELGAVAHTRFTKKHAKRPSYQLWSLRNHDIWENIGASGRIDSYQNYETKYLLD